MKKEVNWIENLRRKLKRNALKLLNNTFWWKIRPTLGLNISGTKCDRDKLIFSAEKGGQSDCEEAYNRYPIGSKLFKNRSSLPCPNMGVPTTRLNETSYHVYTRDVYHIKSISIIKLIPLSI